MPSLFTAFTAGPPHEITSLKPDLQLNSSLEVISRDVNQVFHESESKFLSRSDDIYIKIEYEAALYVKIIFREIYNADSNDNRIIDLTREALSMIANIKDSVSPQGAELYSDIARSKIDEAKNLLDNIHTTH